MADCEVQLQDPEIEEVEAALVDDHEVGGNLVRLTDRPTDLPTDRFTEWAADLPTE